MCVYLLYHCNTKSGLQLHVYSGPMLDILSAYMQPPKAMSLWAAVQVLRALVGDFRAYRVQGKALLIL